MRTARALFVLFLISPYLIWWRSLSFATVSFAGVLPVFAQAFVQAGASAVGALLCGVLLFSGLAALRTPLDRGLGETALLVPNFLPPIFLILSLWVRLFDPGVGAVIGAHVFLNSGLVAIALMRLAETRLAGLAETAWVLGAGRARFLWRVAWPILKMDLGALFLFVFGLCFTSFSIPLLLANGRQVTPEIAIYDAIRIDGDWSKALALALLQTFMMLLFAGLLPKGPQAKRQTRLGLPLLSWAWLKPFVFAPALVLLFALARDFHFHGDDAAILASAALGLSVGLLQVGLSLLAALLSPSARFDRFLTGYLSPSPALVGFGLLLLPLSVGEFLKLSLALVLLGFPLLYRGFLRGELDSLAGQAQTARLLGGNAWRIATRVIWPQALPSILRSGGIAAVWAAGDFALSGILLGRDFQTLPLEMSEAMARYEWSQARGLLPTLLLLTILLYGFFSGAARYVAD